MEFSHPFLLPNPKSNVAMLACQSYIQPRVHFNPLSPIAPNSSSHMFRRHITTHLHSPPPFSFFFLLLSSTSSNRWLTLFPSLTCRLFSARSCIPFAAPNGPSSPASTCALLRSISSLPGVEKVALLLHDAVEAFRGRCGFRTARGVIGVISSGSISFDEDDEWWPCSSARFHEDGMGLRGLFGNGIKASGSSCLSVWVRK